MNDERFSDLKIRRAPNDKFYVTCEAQAICTPTGMLRYFGTMREARLFLTEVKDTELVAT